MLPVITPEVKKLPKPQEEPALYPDPASFSGPRQSEIERQQSFAAHAEANRHATSTSQAGPSGMQPSPAWIDVETKHQVKLISHELTLFLATTLNYPSLGLHHVQQHIITRCPKVIEEGRALGKANGQATLHLASARQALESVKGITASRHLFQDMAGSVAAFVERTKPIVASTTVAAAPA